MGSLTTHPLKERPSKSAYTPRFCDLGDEARSSGAMKGATLSLRVLARFAGSISTVLLALCPVLLLLLVRTRGGEERRQFRPVKSSETFGVLAAYSDPRKVFRASKEPKAMRFAVQPNG